MRKFVSVGLTLAVTGLVAAVCSTSAKAVDTPGVTVGGPIGTTGALADTSVGWSFTLSSAINVTQLGYFDLNFNGLTASHAVAIYNASNVAVVSGTVTPGSPTGTNPGDQFRYVTLASSVVLGPGAYTIAGYTGTTGTTIDPYIVSTANVFSSSPVTYGTGFLKTGGGGVQNPSLTPTSTSTSGYFGPNFRFNLTGTAAPEPGSLALLAPFALPLAGMAIRRRRNANR